jgi:NADPH-dependent F420 reductase
MNMQSIAVIGGTGELGGGLALRWAKAGLAVIIGSRDAGRAQEAADQLNQMAGNDLARGMDNQAAAEAGDIVVLSVKFSHHRDTLTQLKPALKGKIVIDTTVPLVPPKVARVQLPAEGSAAVIAQQILGEDSNVVSAFQNVSAASLKPDAEIMSEIMSDVLVTGDDADARQKAVELAEAAGFTAWHAGPLANSAATEALTSLLIFMNKKYRSDHTGIAITGLNDD